MSHSDLHWWSSPRTLVRSILMLDDTRHSIALGTAIGMFIGLTPTVGIQMVLVGIVSFATYRLFHFNRVAALITVYVSNPVTLVPLYYGLYRVGRVFGGRELAIAEFEAVLNFNGLSGWWNALQTIFVELGRPMLIGTAIVATTVSLLTYPIVRILLARVRPDSSPTPVGRKGRESFSRPPSGRVNSR